MRRAAALADLLGDLIVYCASEARRWGIPLEPVLNTIMESNFSKLGADGQPLYDERGKVLKGPNYWKPEPKIEELLKAHYEKVQK
jgi:predicted HAD superfamily Cof-like phosphohydrolase